MLSYFISRTLESPPNKRLPNGEVYRVVIWNKALVFYSFIVGCMKKNLVTKATMRNIAKPLIEFTRFYNSEFYRLIHSRSTTVYSFCTFLFCIFWRNRVVFLSNYLHLFDTNNRPDDLEVPSHTINKYRPLKVHPCGLVISLRHRKVFPFLLLYSSLLLQTKCPCLREQPQRQERLDFSTITSGCSDVINRMIIP